MCDYLSAPDADPASPELTRSVALALTAVTAPDAVPADLVALAGAVPKPPRGMIDRGLAGFRDRRVLMLQGPIGPFFARLAVDLREEGATVVKVNFNGGDWLFSPRGAFESVVNYRGGLAAWPAAFERILVEHQIDTILLFGDCRPVHMPAIAIAKRRAIEIGVFEEGYLRPDYITIERDGVNNYSSLPRDPDFYRRVDTSDAPRTAAVGSTFRFAARWGALYYCATSLGSPWFSAELQHRPVGWREGRHWVRSGWRKLRYRISEDKVGKQLLGDDPPPFFLVALQTSGDAQVRVHSRFGTVQRFIEHVIRDFAAHAPADTWLVVKHHPLDRGFSDHRALITGLATELGLHGRCHYIHDQHLPTLLQSTLGVVTINSTVGLSAVGEGVPVAVCGDAIYDMPGLTFQGPLSGFWRQAQEQRPEPKLWWAFRCVLIASTQFNGSFYRRLPQVGNASGVFWSKHQVDRRRKPRGRSRLEALLPAKFGPLRAARQESEQQSADR